MPATPPANRRAILLMAASMAFLSANDALMRGLTGHVPVGQLIAGRGLFLCPVMIAACLLLRQRLSLASVSDRWAVVRGLCDLLASFLFVASLSRIPLSVATTLAFSSPIILTALSGPLFGEHPGRWRWLAVIGGFCGVMLVTAPGSADWNPALLLPLGAAALVALREVATRYIPERVSSGSAVLTTAMLAVAGGALTWPFGWVPVAAPEIATMAAASVLLGISFTALVVALRTGELSLVAPVQYTGILWAVFYGALLWGEWPGVREFIGGGVIVCAGLIILYRERVQRDRLSPAQPDPEPMP